MLMRRLQNNEYLFLSLPHSRVHITKTTLEYLGDKFDVEAGSGATREPYLADHKIETYLIVPPKVRINFSSFISQSFIFFTAILIIIFYMFCTQTIIWCVCVYVVTQTTIFFVGGFYVFYK